MDSSIALVAESLATFLRFYFLLLIVRVLLSWFPNINWLNPPFSWVSQMTDPYLNLFRSIIPPMGGFDFSPILAIFLLQIVAGLFGQVATAFAY